jgi:hypothetical protein
METLEQRAMQMDYSDAVRFVKRQTGLDDSISHRKLLNMLMDDIVLYHPNSQLSKTMPVKS